MIALLPTATLILLAWCGLSVLVAVLYHIALAPRRSDRRYRRFERP